MNSEIIEKIIEEKYPIDTAYTDPLATAVHLATVEANRQAAKFGYELGAKEAAGGTVKFGLEAQGHIPYIEKTLADKGFTYHTWREIAAHINWEPLTAACWYHDYCENKREDTNLATEFAVWTQLKNWNYSPTHKEWYKVHEEPQTTEQLLAEFTLFKSLNSKTDGTSTK